MEKLWSGNSYFYTRVKASARKHPNSDNLINEFFKHHAKHPSIQWQSWTNPVYYADAATPLYSVYEEDSKKTWEIPFPDPYPLRIPGEADASISIIDYGRGQVWSLGKVRPQNGTYIAYSVSPFLLGGPGHNTPGGAWLAGGSGIPSLAFLIRPKEIMEGKIYHPLGCATTTYGLGKKYSMEKNFVWPPAAHTDKANGIEEGIVIPEGARIKLVSTVDLDSLGFTETGLIIAKALQEYGAVVVENGGSWHIYAEHVYTAHWNEAGQPKISGGDLKPLDSLPSSVWRVVGYDGLYPVTDSMSNYQTVIPPETEPPTPEPEPEPEQPPSKTLAAQMLPFPLLLAKLYKLRTTFVREEVHRKIHPII